MSRAHSTPEAIACWDTFDKLSNSGREDCIQHMDAIGDVSDALTIGNYARKLATGSADALALWKATNALAKSGVRSPITKVDGVKACITSLGEVLRAQLRQCLRGSDLEPNPCWSDKQKISAPVDPNEKVVLPRRFIQPDQRLHYIVHFENVSDEMEARDVFVTDTLDAHVDLTSLHVMTPAGDTLPLAPGETVTLFERTKTRSVVVGGTVQEIEVLEQWTASLASATRTLSWELLNIDLAPHATDSVAYHVVPSPGLSSGTQLRNAAVIQFEVFSPITTNDVVNIIDTTAPRCDLEAIPPTHTSIARRKFNSGLSCQRTPHVGPFERFGHGFVEILNKG
jgi:hypothetical protein